MDTFQHRHFSASPYSEILKIFLFLGVVANPLVWAATAAPDPFSFWDATLTQPVALPFRSIEPFSALYRFGWEGVGAGEVAVRITSGSTPGTCRIRASGGPNKWIRSLWNYRADYCGEAGVNGEVPSWFHMDEWLSKKSLVSDASFAPDAVFACHHFTTEAKPWLYSRLPGVRDLFAAMLYVRSQPLHDGDHLRLTIFPDRNPYLVDLTVAGRDTITVMNRKIRSIRFSLRIQTIELFGEHRGSLAPHRRFHSGRVWMSDDSHRLPLRAEVDLFVGRVFAEMSQMTPAF